VDKKHGQFLLTRNKAGRKKMAYARALEITVKHYFHTRKFWSIH